MSRDLFGDYANFLSYFCMSSNLRIFYYDLILSVVVYIDSYISYERFLSK